MRGSTLLFLFFSYSVAAQNVTISKFRSADKKLQRLNSRFPVVNIGAKKAIAQKINSDLQSEYRDEVILPQLSDVSFEVKANDLRILSLAISAEACGAYCEGFTNYYTYDVRNGNRISPDTLIAPAYRQILLDSINTRKRNALTQKLAAIEDTLRVHKHWKSEEDSLYYTDMKELYEECLQRTIYNDFSYIKFYLTRKLLYIEVERCSAHVNRNIDELDQFEMYFEVDKWKKYFSGYGLRLVTQ